jgi:hypothetical protein
MYYSPTTYLVPSRVALPLQISYRLQVKSSQVANPRNAFCIEQRAAAKPKEAQVRVFGLFLLLPRLAPVGLIAR